MTPSLAVDLNGVRLPLPVLAASGCLSSEREGHGLVDVHRLGGVVTRTVTLGPSKGSPTPRAAETASGLLSAVGLQNPGLERFVDEELPRLREARVPVIVSIAGSTLEEFIRIANALHELDGIDALEVYLSGPDQDNDGAPFYARPERVHEAVGAVSRLSRLPVFVKLPPLLPDLVETARLCVRDGAHGFTLIDGVPALGVDAERLRPRLAASVGALSGPAIKPIALAAVYRVARAMPEVPIMGVGGIATGEDAVEFLLAGAWAVQVGTAMLVDPSAPDDVALGIQGFLTAKGIGSPTDLRGRLRVRSDQADAEVVP